MVFQEAALAGKFCANSNTSKRNTIKYVILLTKMSCRSLYFSRLESFACVRNYGFYSI